MKQIESKSLTEHVPFTCSFAYELFIKVLGTVGGRRVRGVSVTGTVMTVLGLISEGCSLIGDLTWGSKGYSNACCCFCCFATRWNLFFFPLFSILWRRFAKSKLTTSVQITLSTCRCPGPSHAVNDYGINCIVRGLTCCSRPRVKAAKSIAVRYNSFAAAANEWMLQWEGDSNKRRHYTILT